MTVAQVAPGPFKKKGNGVIYIHIIPLAPSCRSTLLWRHGNGGGLLLLIRQHLAVLVPRWVTQVKLQWCSNWVYSGLLHFDKFCLFSLNIFSPKNQRKCNVYF